MPVEKHAHDKQTSFFLRRHRPAMEAGLVKDLEELRDADLAIGVKTKQILKLLEKKGYVHEQVVHPTLLAVHKENRSGMMVNCWDVHAKGYEALRVGWNMKKLAESYCFEVSHARREEQLKPMKLLVEAADGLLAPCGGTERFLSVSSSHMSQFVRAVHAGCRTEDENLAGINKTLSLESLMQEFEDPAFEAAVGEGWAWSCISSAVEDAAPWLPQLLQAALNSSNHIGRQATEIEVAMLLAYHFGKTKCMETSTQLASAGIPLKYVEAVAHIVQHYGGGPQFPLVKLLGDIEKLFCTSLMLGADFTHAIAYTDFGSKESTFPLVRMMLVACNLSSNKQEDGFARLLVKSDVDKLKAPSQKENLMLAEKQARLVISQLGEDVFQKENVKLLARFLIRCALWLCKKEGKGREASVFGSVAAIHKAFEEEQQGPAAPAGAASAGSAAPSQVQTLQAGEKMGYRELCAGHQQPGSYRRLEVQLAVCWQELCPERPEQGFHLQGDDWNPRSLPGAGHLGPGVAGGDPARGPQAFPADREERPTSAGGRCGPEAPDGEQALLG